MIQETANFETINMLSQHHGFRSAGRFMRHLRGLQELKKLAVREVKIGTRTKLHKLDVERVLSATWVI